MTARRLPLARLALWTTSAAGVLAGVRAAFGHAPPLVLSLGVFGDVFARGPEGRPEIALTFDDGPNPATTPRVLALLAEHGARATFFVLGQKALAHASLVRTIAREGHTVGIHGHVHDRLYSLRSARFVERDLERACAAVEQALGATPTLFRPPVGFVSGAVAVAAERRGLTLVGWSARTLDGWSGTPPERVLARATATLENGAILVLHDAAERDDRVPASLDVLGELLGRVRERGLRAVTIDALRREA